MSVHDHHNDPNDPVNQPGRRSKSVDPAGHQVDSPDRRDGVQGMGPGTWVAGIVLLLALIAGVIYSMSDGTTTATNTGTPPAGSSAPSTTGTGAGTNPPATPRPTTPPASPAPAR